MTTRVFIILLMLVQVLACPFLDCGECRGACAARCVVADDACDDCCKSESDAATAVCEHRSDSCDDPACPDNPGPLNCLCGGAVQANDVDCPDLLAGGEFPALPEVTLSETGLRLVAMSAELSLEGCPHFPPLITGTSLCALTQTYLL
ncbi:MAG: hypothetical protein HQ518_17265 [Rhodopirellula sp.]|nr:hypothetical protein [Rhodopirellula sp.]